MQIIAIINQKGGVGKSAAAVNLGAGLVQQGKKVLLVDADGQTNLTEMLGWQQAEELSPTLSTMLEQVIADRPISPKDGILHHKEGMDLIPANIELSGLEVSLVNNMSRETVMRTYINEVRRSYDYIRDVKTDTYEKIELFGKELLLTTARIDCASVPEGLHLYGLRHDDEDWCDPVEIGKGILVNF